ncbi:ATP-binding cassette domain-containing protein [Actinomadura sp. LD22]|uniref:ATP-binding cassette domain-containing protein n=1 Tax=Actinomadura physcomitrii TaxID=2650748 RepID=A0A6I4M366_9ACTN|nr:ATP-binding cassette domain-containing protein [Actinomadura physcomitrii]MVZ99901.1 ATP-binding cassette domain-containing protein [Actinomadura physcomitrii]
MTAKTDAADENAVLPARAGETVLEARKLSAGYGGVPVTHELDLRVGAGEVVALLGANGAGKSTTLLTLAGVLGGLGGEVFWLGRTDPAPLHLRSRLGLAFIPETRSIIAELSAEDNLRLGRGPVDLALEYVPELKKLLKRRAGLLSGGEQQMLTLARVLAARPKVLLADEMSLGLAPLIVERLLAAIRRAADEEAIGALIVEQQVRNVLAVSDHAYVLRRGRLVMSGPAGEMRTRTDEIESHYLAGPPA